LEFQAWTLETALGWTKNNIFDSNPIGYKGIRFHIMKTVHYFCVIFLLLAAGGCSDLLGSEELQAELEKMQNKNGIPVHFDNSVNYADTPAYFIDGEIWEGERLSEISPEDISHLEISKDPKEIKKYGLPPEAYTIVLITTKKKAKN
jgi:hypothetical protein